jgi:hypothetical protein
MNMWEEKWKNCWRINTTTEKPGRKCFHVGHVDAVQGGQLDKPELSHVEVGLNTPTAVVLRVIGDEKGSLEFETVKYRHKSHGTGT